jgi:uncharacterized HAD superfamily protein
MKERYNSIPMGKGLTIAIDIDGTIADPSAVDFDRAHQNPYELMKAKPIREALKVIKKFHAEGHIIVFHSSRIYGSKKVTEKWLKKHGFPFHHIEMRKFLAHVYIDDRAINGRNWKHVVREIRRADLPGKVARSKGFV